MREEISDPLTHPVVQAWKQLCPTGIVPDRIIRLKGKTKKVRGVYCLEGVGPRGSAVVAKCAKSTTKGRVEILTYERLLPELPVTTLRYYGCIKAVDNTDSKGQEEAVDWLFVEHAGDERYSPHLSEHRALAAHWLAAVHTAEIPTHVEALLPKRPPTEHLRSVRRLIAYIERTVRAGILRTDSRTIFESILKSCQFVEGQWSLIAELCDQVPRTLVHGDFHEKNIFLRRSSDSAKVLAFDWESAAIGVPVFDLGCSTLESGYCQDPDTAAYVMAVRDHWPSVDATTVRRLANVGKALWWVKGTSSWLKHITNRTIRQAATPEWLGCRLRFLELCDRGFSAAIKGSFGRKVPGG